MVLELIVNSQDEGVKPKLFLKKKLDLSFYDLVNCIKDKSIKINKKKIKKDQVLKAGDVISIWKKDIVLREKEIKKIKAADLKIETIFENEDFIVLNKLPGVVVQGSHDSSEALQLHIDYLKSLANSKDEWMHVHRLDKDTSGCLVIGKNVKSIRELNKLFHDKKVKKIYHAIVIGHVEKDFGDINLSLIRNPENSKQKVSVSNLGKNTISKFKVIDRFNYDNEDLSLVEIEIITGFMHQIRVHMKNLGHPLLGDDMYGIKSINQLFKDFMPHHALHAHNLVFDYEGEHFDFVAPYPKTFQDFLMVLKK